VKLELTIDGVVNSIEVLALPPACRFRLGDRPERSAHVEQAEPGAYSVLMEGRSYDAHVEESASTLVVTVAGHRFEIKVNDPRKWTGRSGAPGASGTETVAAPMPGKVVRVLVAAGDAIEAGQGLVVVEAMKMQNEMRTVRSGRVLRVAVKEGDAVAAGQVLVSLE
jgi:biotin carboxyl carrier protein